MLRITVGLFLFLNSLAVAADDEAAPVELSVRPLLCIVDSRTPACDLSFAIAWRSVETGYYCVFTDSVEQPLRCWTEHREGELSDQRRSEQDFSYWITSDDTATPLASATVEVLRMDSDDRRRERRTRHVWDVF